MICRSWKGRKADLKPLMISWRTSSALANWPATMSTTISSTLRPNRLRGNKVIKTASRLARLAVFCRAAFRHKHIPHAPHGLDVHRLGRIDLNQLAQAHRSYRKHAQYERRRHVENLKIKYFE